MVTVPREANTTPRDKIQQLKSAISTSKDYCDLFEFNIPSEDLPIGSLDTLVSFSDSLARTDREFEVKVFYDVESEYLDILNQLLGCGETD